MPDSPSTDSGPLTLGFVTVQRDDSGYYGGYLATNSWGRPLEFRLTSAVQPNRVQEILYGPTLEEFLHAELIAKTLIEKATVPPNLIVTDQHLVMALHRRITIPVLWVPAAEQAVPQDVLAIPRDEHPGQVYLPKEASAMQTQAAARLAQVDPAVDLTEPFARIREALREARKTGVAQRAA